MDDDKALKIISTNLKRLRGDMSYAEMARIVGTYPTSIKRIEDGESMPGAGLLTRIAAALGVSASDLLSENKKNTVKSH